MRRQTPSHDTGICVLTPAQTIGSTQTMRVVRAIPAFLLPYSAFRKGRPEAMHDSGQIHASSLGRALNVVGDAWTVLILKEAFLGVRRFNELQERLGIPRQTLTLRLASLAENHILYKRPTLHRTLVREYRLTPKGLDLYDFIVSIWAWHKRWDIGPHFLPGDLVHKPCSHLLDVRMICRACAEPVRRTDVRTEPGEGAGFDPKPVARHSRLNDAAFAKSIGVEAARMVATTVVGDRWSNLVLDAIFRGVNSFQAIKIELEIASNILSSRLKKLTELGLIASSSDGRRIDYHVTERGEGLYEVFLSLSAWGDRWLSGAAGVPEVRVHRGDHVLDARYVCVHCGKTVRAWDVGLPTDAKGAD